MTAADELERMAEEFRDRFDTCVAHARDVRAHEASYGVCMAKADAFLEVETALRARSAELRTVAPGSWSDANGTVALAEDGTIDCRRLDGSKVLDLGEGIPLVLDCLAALLRERGAAPAPDLPKPERVEAGSRWLRDERIEVKAMAGSMALIGSGVAIPARQLLEDPRWRYLGNGEQSDIGGSEVAGEVER